MNIVKQTVYVVRSSWKSPLIEFGNTRST